MQPRIAPSILSADFANLDAELKTVDSADLIHVDVMDGHFVPNLTIGLPVVKRIQEVSTVPLDVHLMIENPERWAKGYAATGAHSVTFHFEAASDPLAVIASIKSEGSSVAMALKPNTPFQAVAHLVSELDMLLIMTVEPGFGGQSLIESMIPKITEARSHILDASLSCSIQVDGGVTSENISMLAAAGADTFVAGTSVFSAADRNRQIKHLRELASNL